MAGEEPYHPGLKVTHWYSDQPSEWSLWYPGPFSCEVGDGADGIRAGGEGDGRTENASQAGQS